MSLIFEWDPSKSISNRKKHGVSFEEASTVFGDPLSVTVPESQVRAQEHRFVTVGESKSGKLLVVIHLEKNDIIRIISARKATSRERKQYEGIM